MSWRLLGIHGKPCGLLNVGGYFDGLLKFLDYAVTQRFIKPEHRARVLVEEQPEQLVETLERNFVTGGRWLKRKAQT